MKTSERPKKEKQSGRANSTMKTRLFRQITIERKAKCWQIPPGNSWVCNGHPGSGN